MRRSDEHPERYWAEVFRRWLTSPGGKFDDHWSNERAIKNCIEFMIQPLLQRFAKPRFHEFWCDGVYIIHCLSHSMNDLRFAGTAIFSDRHASQEWFAPFELSLVCQNYFDDIPRFLSLKFGVADDTSLIRRLGVGSAESRLSTANEVYEDRPQQPLGWAVNFNVDPYLPLRA